MQAASSSEVFPRAFGPTMKFRPAENSASKASKQRKSRSLIWPSEASGGSDGWRIMARKGTSCLAEAQECLVAFDFRHGSVPWSLANIEALFVRKERAALDCGGWPPQSKALPRMRPLA